MSPTLPLPTFSQLRAHVLGAGLRWFAAGPYDLNLVALRHPSRRADRFDDVVIVATTTGLGTELLLPFAITTDPGKGPLARPSRSDGTAIMLPGQYRGLYKLGLHNRSKPGKAYEALEQVRPARFTRDNNRDGTLDLGGPSFEDVIKANLHRAGLGSKATDPVGAYSAACQVMPVAAEFELLLDLVRAQKAHGLGDEVTYTLQDWPSRWP